jgi:hypothetical protein
MGKGYWYKIVSLDCFKQFTHHSVISSYNLVEKGVDNLHDVCIYASY